MTDYFKKVTKGFTLIELLIVMAILGVLAVVVLVAINPVQQLARTRDTGRKSAVTQMGHALEAFYTARNGAYPATLTWANNLTAAGELSIIPGSIGYGAGTATPCAINVTQGWCYKVNGTTSAAIVYARMESNIERSKCSTTDVYFVYSTSDGRGGIICTTDEAGVVATSQVGSWSTFQ